MLSAAATAELKEERRLQQQRKGGGYMSFDDLSKTMEESCLSSFTSEDKIEESTYNSDVENAGGRLLTTTSCSYLDEEDSISVAYDKAKKFMEEKKNEERVQIGKTKNASSTLVNVSGETFVDYYGICLNEKWSKIQTNALARKNAILYQRYYLGATTESKAQEKCQFRTQWFMYHRVNISLSDATCSYSEDRDYPSTSQLYIVYRRSNGEHEHYQIRTKTFKEPTRHSIFYADYGDPQAPHFPSIYGLINFYDNFAYIEYHGTRQNDAEAFPLWKRAKPIPTISEYSGISSSGPGSWLPNDSIFDPTLSITTNVSKTTLSSSSISDGKTRLNSSSQLSSSDDSNVSKSTPLSSSTSDTSIRSSSSYHSSVSNIDEANCDF